MGDTDNPYNDILITCPICDRQFHPFCDFLDLLWINQPKAGRVLFSLFSPTIQLMPDTSKKPVDARICPLGYTEIAKHLRMLVNEHPKWRH